MGRDFMLNIFRKNYENEKLNLPEGFTVTAHTGCMGTKENTLEAIETGAKSGANIIEFDLRTNKNGDLVLSHDEPTGEEKTLCEAFEFFKQFDGIKANVDIKATEALENVYPLAKECGVENRIFYTGVNDGFVEAVKTKSPEFSYFLNVKVNAFKKNNRKYLLSLVEKVKNAGAVGINFKYTSASKKLVEIFHENGLLVSIWTVNDEYNMHKILSFGPDNITTRKPDELTKIISQKK